MNIYGTLTTFLPTGILEPQPTAKHAGKLVSGHPGFRWLEVADPTPPPEPDPEDTETPKVPFDESLEDMSFKDLKALAKLSGIKTHKRKRADIIQDLGAEI